MNLVITVQHGAYHFSALQLKDLKLPFPLGWISTNKRFIYLVRKRLVNLVHQPGEGASVYRLGKRVPCVGCLLQVQRTDQLHAGGGKKPFNSHSTEGLSFPISSLINSHLGAPCLVSAHISCLPAVRAASHHQVVGPLHWQLPLVSEKRTAHFW